MRATKVFDLFNIRANPGFSNFGISADIFDKNVASQRPGRYLETFLEPVASLSLRKKTAASHGDPFRPTIMDFVSVDSEVMCLETGVQVCGYSKSVGTAEMDLYFYNTSVGTAALCFVGTRF